MKKQIHPSIKAHILRSAFLLLALLAVCIIPFALAQRGLNKRPSVPKGTCPNPWQEVAPMPTDLFGDACASDGTFVYCGGGYSFSSGTTLAVFNRYDPGLNIWTSLPDMPQSASMAVAVYYPPTNKIYIFGGEDAVSGTNYNITRIYDIAANIWSTGANMPDVRSFMAGGYVSATGKIYILSGYNTGDVTSAQPNTWEYDPVMDMWTDLTGTAPFPHPAGGFAFGVINDKLYVAGGRDAANLIINDTWEFDPSVPVYNAKADEPGLYQNNVPGSGAALNALWVFGGGNPFLAPEAGITKATAKAAFPVPFIKAMRNRPSIPATDNQTRFYDPSTDTWGSFSSMNEFRSFPGSTSIGDMLVATGGYNGSGTVASVEAVAACFPTPTPPQCDTGAIQNEGFETGDFPPWVIDGTSNPPVVTTDQVHSGTFSALAGNVTGPEPLGDSSFYQEFTVPAGTSTLSFWHWDYTTDSITFDWQDAYITDTSGTILQTIFHQCANGQTWINTNVDMTPYAGQTVRIKFLVHQDGFGDDTGMYVDDAELTVPCGSPTPTPTATPTSTPTATPTATPTPTPTATPTVTPTPTATPTATPTPTPSGCVFSQGYWKNHPEAWPVTSLQLGNVTYTQDQLLSILHQPVRGNGILILAHQEIAAKLNIANGADGSCIQQTLADADALIGDLVIPPIGDGYLLPRDASPLADILDQYNEGMLCAPSCDNSSPSPSPRATPRQHPPVHPRPGR